MSDTKNKEAAVRTHAHNRSSSGHERTEGGRGRTTERVFGKGAS